MKKIKSISLKTSDLIYKLNKNYFNRVKNYLTKRNAGLLLDIFGAVLVAFSYGSYPGIKSIPYKTLGFTFHYQEAGLIHPRFFYMGILLLIIGFILQLKSK